METGKQIEMVPVCSTESPLSAHVHFVPGSESKVHRETNPNADGVIIIYPLHCAMNIYIFMIRRSKKTCPVPAKRWVHINKDTHKNLQVTQVKKKKAKAYMHHFSQHCDSCKPVATAETEGSTNNVIPYENISVGTESGECTQAWKQTHTTKSC